MGLALPKPEGRLEQPADDPQWFVVRAKNRKEDFAVQQLERRGVRVFLPRILEWGREQVAPLFPGYLFVNIGLHAQYYSVIWTPGVRGFIAFGAIPTPVPEGVIRLIVNGASEGGVIRPRSVLKAGDRVQIRRGPLAGLMAVIEEPCSQRGRVKILLDFLRRGASLELPVGLVDRV